MIFHDSQIVFIHIPKTGGTTIERLLLENKHVSDPDTHFGVHHRLDQVYKRYGNEEDKDNIKNLSAYHMFVVARNPWERYASLYVHDYNAFYTNPRNKKREFISIEEYVYNNISENFFNFIEVNGTIPDNLMIIGFDDFRNGIKRVFDTMGLKSGRIYHENKKLSSDKTMMKNVIKNKVFQDRIAEMCAKEIELFSYELPVDS